MSWYKTDLANVIAVLQSGSRPKGGVSTDSGEVMSLGGENIVQKGGVDLRDVKRVPHAFYEAMTKGCLQDRDVLINKDGANTGKVGLFRDPGDGPACINEHLFLLRGAAAKITQEYLYYMLLSEHGQTIIRNRISGSAQPGLKSGFINHFPIDLPESTDEQERIGEILGTLDRSIEQTEALIAKQQRIETGLMQDLLTKGVDEHGNIRSEATHAFKDSPLGRIPVEWSCGTFGELWTGGAQNGLYKPQSAYSDEGTPIVRIDGFRNGDLIEHQTFKRVELSSIEQRSFGLELGDIVVNRVNSIEWLGKVALVGRLSEATVFESNMMRIRVDKKRLVPEFAILILSGPRTYRHFLKCAKTAIAQASINQEDVRSLLIACPPPPEQAEIIRRVDALHRLIVGFLSAAEKLVHLKSGLMHDLLTGERRITALLTQAAHG